jgi:hypothetical protein
MRCDIGYTFNDAAALKARQSGKSREVHPAAMRKYEEWRHLIKDRGVSPVEAARQVGKLRIEKLTGNMCSIRLTHVHRVLFLLMGSKLPSIPSGTLLKYLISIT